MAQKDPVKVARKWKERLSASEQAIKDGVTAVTVSPTIKAAENLAAYEAGVREAISSGKTEAALRAVSNEEWKSKMLKKGVPRVASGAQEAESEQVKFFSELLPFTASVSEQIRGMPNTSKEERRARMNRNFDLMSEFKRRGR